MLLLAAAACGDDDGHHDDDPDAEVPDDPDAEPPPGDEITVHARGSALVAIRPDVAGGEWTTLTPDANGDATTEVDDGPFRIVSVCDRPDFFNYFTVLATIEDGPEFELSCATDAPITVTYQAQQNVTVHIGFLTGNAGTLDITPGTYDVIVIDHGANPPRALIQRDVDLTADANLTWDLTANGFDLVAATVEVTNPPNDEGFGANRVRTANGTRAIIDIEFGTDQAWLFPASALAADDRQTVAMTYYDNANGYRQAIREAAGSEATLSLTLGEGITSATATWDGAPSVTWETDGTFISHYFSVFDENFTTFWDIDARDGWLDANGHPDALAIDDPTGIPGWDASWTVDDPAGLWWGIFVFDDDVGGLSHAAGWDDEYPAALARRAGPRPAMRVPEVVLKRMR